MAKRTILEEGNPVLNRKSRPVTRFDAHLKTLIQDMLETMYDDDGVGLAAPQVGVLRRLFVMDIDDGNGATVLINPRIVETKGERLGIEGCLSIPGLYGAVRRPEEVLVAAQDEEGHDFEVRLTGLGAQCACHECDHLDGILFRRRAETPLKTIEELRAMMDSEHPDGEETPEHPCGGAAEEGQEKKQADDESEES